MRIQSQIPQKRSDLRSLAAPLSVNTTGLTRRQTGEAIASSLLSSLDSINIPVSGFFEFNVKSYGASGDGITDDSIALQNAFDTMINSGERNILRIPPGIYRFTTPLRWVSPGIPFNVVSEGAVLLWDSSDAATAVTIGSNGSTIDRCLFANLDIYNNTRNWTIAASGVEFVNLLACNITDLSVTSFFTGIVLYGDHAPNTYNRFTLNRVRGNRVGLSVKRSGVSGYVTQQRFVGGTWSPGSVDPAQFDKFWHVILPSSSLISSFVFDFCSFEGSFSSATPSASAYVFDIGSNDNVFSNCRFEFMAASSHIEAFGIFQPSSSFNRVLHNSSDIRLIMNGSYSEARYGDMVNNHLIGTELKPIEGSTRYPRIYGRLGVNQQNNLTYGLAVTYDPKLTEAAIGSSAIMQVGTSSPTLGATSLLVYSGTGYGIYAQTFTGTPCSLLARNVSYASVSNALTITHATTGTSTIPLSGYFGSSVTFRSSLADSASYGAMATVQCISDNVSLANKTGRLRFITYGGSGTYTGLQISNSGFGGEPKVGFFGNSPVVKPTVSGYRSGTAMASLLVGLEKLGLVTDATEDQTYLYLLWSAATSGDSSYKLRVGGNNALNRQTAGFFESGTSYAVWAQTRTGGTPFYGSILGSSATSDPTVMTLSNIGSGITPSAGFGTSIVCSAIRAGGSIGRQLFIRNTWVDSGASTYKSRWRFHAHDAASSTTGREVLRGEASGSAPMIGFLGANASTRITVTGNTFGSSGLVSLANALQTFGLVTSTLAPSGFNVSVITVGTSGTSGSATLTNLNDICICKWRANITLPPASSLPGKVYAIKSRSNETVTIYASGADTIDDDATLEITTKNSAVWLISDGSIWNTL